MYNTNAVAVLCECGFLSNNDELAKLKDDNYQKSIAAAICDGIIEYINNSVECSTDGY